VFRCPFELRRIENRPSLIVIGVPHFTPQKIKTDYPLGQSKASAQVLTFRPLVSSQSMGPDSVLM
jgi:hypothetical protein